MTVPPLDIPAAYTQRPVDIARDAAAVTALIHAEEVADLGHSVVSEADLLGDWARPSFDPAEATVLVEDAGGSAVGYAELVGREWGVTAVHPAHRGRGIGTAIARWTQATVRARGGRSVGENVPQGCAGDRLLAELGYAATRTAWDLERPADGSLVMVDAPPGYLLREGRPDEYEAAWTVVEDAFLEWADRPRHPLEDWLATHARRPGFAPWHLRVAEGPAGAVEGVAVLHVDGTRASLHQLAVRADRRGCGLGAALLTEAFGEAERRGASELAISTDSRSGAVDLYTRLGLQVTSTWTFREFALTD